LYDLVVDDMERLQSFGDTMRLRSQQIASADSICANMEEGVGRWTTKESARYLTISRSRGSAAETQGHYGRMKRWLPGDIVQDRIERCNEILAILTTSISKLRAP
jgi:four helix bundle protein